jgi:hypothetical protein
LKYRNGFNFAMDDWPFDQPPNFAVITLRLIADRKQPILHVTHDADDHGWQFLGWEDANVEEGVVVCFSHIVEFDPSIRELADLPPGWHAWRRTVDEPWTRVPNPHADDD